ncbi:hypothetical protein FRB99_005958 [Tulasnella sp. 403]|nr:hypothetical protein FRB99_005958 [Tulasnella sp. 403]
MEEAGIPTAARSKPAFARWMRLAGVVDVGSLNERVPFSALEQVEDPWTMKDQKIWEKAEVNGFISARLHSAKETATASAADTTWDFDFLLIPRMCRSLARIKTGQFTEADLRTPIDVIVEAALNDSPVYRFSREFRVALPMASEVNVADGTVHFEAGNGSPEVLNLPPLSEPEDYKMILFAV